MRWQLSESVLKGLYLGLVLSAALQQLDWPAVGLLALTTAAGLLVCLGVAAWGKVREGYRVKGRRAAFALFLLLESPGLVYAGILLGTFVGVILVRRQWSSGSDEWFLTAVGGGAALGVVFWLLRHVRDRWFRVGLSFALAAALVAGAFYWLQLHPDFFRDPSTRQTFGVQLLIGIPFFYLLTFTGVAEESEVETGAICAALGVGLWAAVGDWFNQPAVCFLLPLVLYFVYTMRVLPGLRVFKHAIRGIGHANVGRYRAALLAFRRALQLDPNNALAREQLWRLHRSMDLQQLSQDPQTLALVDLDLCLERARSLLLSDRPDADRLQEAHHLLDLVASQRPALAPVLAYWRAVAHTHARNYDQAAAELTRVVDPAGHAPSDPHWRSILLAAWQLALTLHPELNRRVGTPQLALPGRRVEAIAAVERRLTQEPEDADAWTLKRILYSGLTEPEYIDGLRTRVPTARVDAGPGDFVFVGLEDFDHAYAQQLGLALVNDPARWQRGVEYLRIAAHGLPAQGPTLFQPAAQAYERAGDAAGMWRSLELARQAGRKVGPAQLGEEDRKAYFAIVKRLGEHARAGGDLDNAIENYRLYTEYERSGVETLRTLAQLYEDKGDALNALRVTDRALQYDAKDKDLLERKERYYYSVVAEDLRANLETIRPGFDVDYCLQKARSLLDLKEADAELIAWAEHLAELAHVVQPDSLTARLLRARALRRRGEIDQARELLAEARANKPSRFGSSQEEDAWYLSSRLLGEMYLYELGRPDLAVPCFNDFRQSHRSGADTLYKLGQAYEQLGDRARAMKCYEHVTAYESHPLAPDAREALYRLQSSTA